jgi:hypothetical protein
MDLAQFLLKQAEVLQKQLQNLLEKSEEETRLSQLPFSATTDLRGIEDLGLGLPTDFNLRIRILFARLHCYFEAGVLFNKKDQSWCPIEAFQRGHCFEMSAKEKMLEFDFPEMTLVEVKKARSQAVISDLGLEDYLSNQKITALVFRPHPEFLFLTLSEIADPWLKILIEKTQNQILKLLADHLP